jgi:hypothetical protein
MKEAPRRPLLWRLWMLAHYFSCWLILALTLVDGVTQKTVLRPSQERDLDDHFRLCTVHT